MLHPVRDNLTSVQQASPLTPLVAGPRQGPAGPRFPNPLVNDPEEDGNSPRDTHSETTIAVIGSTVLSAYNDSFNANLNPMKYTGFSRSTDRGLSFTDGLSLPNTPGGDGGDPVLAHDNETGRTYLATLSFANQISIWRSDDDLQTFLPTVVNGAPGRSNLDKEWLVVDNFPGTGQGNVYHIVRDFSSGNGIYFFRSTDQGATFGPGGGVLIAAAGSGNVQGAWVAVGPDHTVYTAWYQSTDIAGTNGKLMMRKSTDQGQTFGAPVLITNLQTVGINGDLHLGGFRSNTFSQLLANPVNNQLYIVYPDKGTGSHRAEILFRQSNDGGTTWSDAVHVVDDTTNHDQWQPALAVTPNGNKVGVFWYDRRLDPANNLIDRFGAIGVVAGEKVTFGPNFRISEESFPPEFGHDPAIIGTYMGDYDQAVADTGSFYVTWGDNRLPSRGHIGRRADVRFARIPVDVAGPSVISLNPSSTFAPISTLRVTFDEEIDAKTATPDQFVLTDAQGQLIKVAGVSLVKGSTNHQFDVAFTSQTVAGIYHIDIGPNIADTKGHLMDQDGDGVPGEKTDVFHGRFTIRNPSITSVARNGNPSNPPTSVRVTFDEPMNVATFTTASVTNFTDPAGQPIAVNKVTPVDGSNGRQFDVFFDAQRTFGTYQIVIGPDILDLFDNPMIAAFTGNFLVTPVYTAQEYPFEDLDIHGQPGTFRVIQYADDVSVPVNLGTHTFNFYGVVYTGNNRLFASSNALITFGTANNAFTNTNLTNSPPEAAIAPLWSDWIKRPPGTDMLEALIDGNRLILQWNEIQHFVETPRGITFQLILTLDTGGLPGDIVFNYVDLDTGEPVHSNGRSSTVGLKDRGNQGPDRLLVSFNAPNPLVGSNKAILLSANGPGQFAPSGGSRLGLAEQIAALVGDVSAPGVLVLAPDADGALALTTDAAVAALPLDLNNVANSPVFVGASTSAVPYSNRLEMTDRLFTDAIDQGISPIADRTWLGLI